MLCSQSTGQPRITAYLADNRMAIVDPLTGNSCYVSSSGAKVSMVSALTIPVKEQRDPKGEASAYQLTIKITVPRFNHPNERSSQSVGLADRFSRCASQTGSSSDLTPRWYKVDMEHVVEKFKSLRSAAASISSSNGRSACCLSTVFEKWWKNADHVHDSADDAYVPDFNNEKLPVISFSKRSLGECVQLIGSFHDSLLVCSSISLEKTIQATGMVPSAFKSLILIDQHALDERIRMEHILNDLLVNDCLDPHVRSVMVMPHLRVELVMSSLAGLIQYTDEFARMGLRFVVQNPGNEMAVITHVPAMLLDKHRISSNRDNLRHDVYVLIDELLEIFRNASSLAFILPMVMHNWIATAACRGAVMFGDAVANEKAKSMLKDGFKCDLPFQCAHGRPSMIAISFPKPPDPKHERTLSWEYFSADG